MSDLSKADDIVNNPLSSEEIQEVSAQVAAIKTALPQLPSKIGAEVTSLLATAEGHLEAHPPNAVATLEAIELIRDQLDSTDSAVARTLSARLTPVLRMLGEPDPPQ